METESTEEKADILLANRHFADLNPIVAGHEHCQPRHRFGPSVRWYTLLHCVLSGRGRYTRGGVTYPVEQGQIFLILPDEETVYEADEADPWHYAWIGFDGALSERMATMPPVFDASPAVLRIFQTVAEESGASEYRVTSLLFRLYDELFGRGGTGGNEYVRRVRSYIDATYMKRISIEQLAEQLHLNRRYLTCLFHEETGMSIRDYLLRTRMRKATEQLQAGASVGEAAALCGYEDMFLFSRLFKRIYGVSPANWRRREDKG